MSAVRYFIWQKNNAINAQTSGENNTVRKYYTNPRHIPRDKKRLTINFITCGFIASTIFQTESYVDVRPTAYSISYRTAWYVYS